MRNSFLKREIERNRVYMQAGHPTQQARLPFSKHKVGDMECDFLGRILPCGMRDRFSHAVNDSCFALSCCRPLFTLFCNQLRNSREICRPKFAKGQADSAISHRLFAITRFQIRNSHVQFCDSTRAKWRKQVGESRS